MHIGKFYLSNISLNGYKIYSESNKYVPELKIIPNKVIAPNDSGIVFDIYWILSTGSFFLKNDLLLMGNRKIFKAQGDISFRNLIKTISNSDNIKMLSELISTLILNIYFLFNCECILDIFSYSKSHNLNHNKKKYYHNHKEINLILKQAISSKELDFNNICGLDVVIENFPIKNLKCYQFLKIMEKIYLSYFKIQ